MTATYDCIATTTLGSTSSLITFSSIPGTYTDLVFILSGRSSSGTNYYQFKFNSDTGSNYSRTAISGDGASATSERYSNETVGYPIVNPFPTAADTFDASIVTIFNYANSTTFKTYLGRGNNSAARVSATVGLWRSTNAITQVDISPFTSTFASGSTFTLYGIKAE